MGVRTLFMALVALVVLGVVLVREMNWGNWAPGFLVAVLVAGTIFVLVQKGKTGR